MKLSSILTRLCQKSKIWSKIILTKHARKCTHIVSNLRSSLCYCVLIFNSWMLCYKQRYAIMAALYSFKKHPFYLYKWSQSRQNCLMSMAFKWADVWMGIPQDSPQLLTTHKRLRIMCLLLSSKFNQNLNVTTNFNELQNIKFEENSFCERFTDTWTKLILVTSLLTRIIAYISAFYFGWKLKFKQTWSMYVHSVIKRRN
jgi:hypothetical protein